MSVPDHSLRSLFTRYDLLRTITGANPYQSGRDTRTLIAQDLEMGRVVAIDESFRDWSSVTEIFTSMPKGNSRLPRWSAWAGIR